MKLVEAGETAALCRGGGQADHARREPKASGEAEAPGVGGCGVGCGFALRGLKVEGVGQRRLKLGFLGRRCTGEVALSCGEGAAVEDEVEVDGPSGLTSLPACGGRDGFEGRGLGGVAGDGGEVAKEMGQDNILNRVGDPGLVAEGDKRLKLLEEMAVASMGGEGTDSRFAGDPAGAKAPFGVELARAIVRRPRTVHRWPRR